jgi:hypothetical protein
MSHKNGLLLVAAVVSMVGCALGRDESLMGSAASNDTSATPRFTYEDLVGLIQREGLTSVEQVLPQLPAELRSNYALMRDSRSLQFASAQNPRVILFGVDARLTCAFSGDSTQPHFDTLECFQFREAERKFDFREIQFPTAANGLGQVVFSRSNLSTDGTTECTACHGGDPRPNWDAYSNWPGAYGTDDDTEKSPEYDAFVARRPTDARYRWLIQGSESYDPYMGGDDFHHAHRPNLKFGDAVNRMNAFRTTRIMTQRVRASRSLGFAIGSLKCALSQDQLDKLTHAGVDVNAALDLNAIFAQVNYPSDLWGTNVLGDADTLAPYDHQSGYSFLAMDMGMVMAQDLARAGDARLQQGLAAVAKYTSTDSYVDGDGAYFSTLNELVPDPQLFSAHFSENVQQICPALGDAFVNAAVAAASE